MNNSDARVGTSVHRYAESLCSGRAVGGTVAAARPARRAGDLSALSGADGIHSLYHSEKPDDMPGVWQQYYQKWRALTRDRIDPDLLDLLPELRRLVPPATVIDKNRYSAFAGAALPKHLRDRRADTLIVTGSETDVCVLATVLGAVDCGFCVVVVTDGICSSSDEGHDALLTVYHRRFSEQIQTADVENVLSAWPR